MLILLTREIWCCQSVKALCRARPNLLVQSSARVPSNSHMHSEGQLSSSEICCCSRLGWVPALDADLAVGTHSDLFTELQSVWDDMSLLKFKAWSLTASQSIHPMRLGDDGAEYSHKAAAFKSRHGRNVHPSSAQWKNMVYILYIYIKLWRLDPDAEAGTWTLGVVDLASSPTLCHFFAHDSCSMIQYCVVVL